MKIEVRSIIQSIHVPLPGILMIYITTMNTVFSEQYINLYDKKLHLTE